MNKGGRRGKEGGDTLIAKPKGKTPWKRGPAAYEVALVADDLLEEMAGMTRTHLSLREAAQLLRISTQPLRDWYADGWVNKGPLKRKFPVEELRRFVTWVGRHAKPFDMRDRLKRFRKRGDPLPGAWAKLLRAKFEWPKGCPALRPKDLAILAGCHPSLVTKAIAARRLPATRRGKVGWEISKRDWLWRY